MTERKWEEVEIQLVSTLNRAISEAPDLVNALTIALKTVCELTNWDYGEAWIPTREGTLIELSPAWYINTRRGSAYVHILEQFRLCSEKFILTPGVGLPGRVWLSQQPEWICDVSAETERYFLRHYIAKAFGIRAGFGVPILNNRQVMGVLVFFMSQARAEDSQTVKLALAAATQLLDFSKQRAAMRERGRGGERFMLLPKGENMPR